MSAAVQLPLLPPSEASVRATESLSPAPGVSGAAEDFAVLLDVLQLLSAAMPTAVAAPSAPETPATATSAEQPLSPGLWAKALLLAAVERGVAGETVGERPDPERANTPGRPEPAALAPIPGAREERLGVATAPLRPELQQAASVTIPREAGAFRDAPVPAAERERASARTASTQAASVTSERTVSESPPTAPAVRSAVAALHAANPTERAPREVSSSQPLERKTEVLFTQARESAPAAQNSDSEVQNALVHATRGSVESAPRQLATPAEATIAQRVSWLATRGGGSARVVLHPAELGEVEISVRVRGNRVEVSIQTEVAATRTALIASRDALNESFLARDLRIESLDVRVAEARPTPGGDGNPLGSSGRETVFDQANTNRGSQQGRDDGQHGSSAQNGAPEMHRFQASAEGERARSGQLDLHA